MRRRPPARAHVAARSRLVAPTHHALARHRPTRGLWVFAFRSAALVGVCGPLEGDPPPPWLLPHFDFDSPTARANLPIVRARMTEFDRLA